MKFTENKSPHEHAKEPDVAAQPLVVDFETSLTGCLGSADGDVRGVLDATNNVAGEHPFRGLVKVNLGRLRHLAILFSEAVR
jgi:hypothetical protein